MRAQNLCAFLVAAVAAVIFASPVSAGHCVQQIQVQPVVQYQVAVPVIQQVVAQYPVYAAPVIQQQVVQQYAQPVVQQVVVQKQRQRVLFQRAPRVQKIVTKQRIVNR